MKSVKESNINQSSRRIFLQTSSLFLGGLAAHSAIPYKNLFSSRDNNELKVGLIGCGNRGSGLAASIKDIKGVKITACCDVIPAHIKNALEYIGNDVKTYSDYRKLLEDKSIDAVIIATPLFLHYPMAIDAIDAGKHVYLEKSMTYNIQQSLNLAKKVQNLNLVFQVGYQYRYYSLYRQAKEAITQNWLGKVTHFECQYNRNSNWRVPVSDPKLERTLNWRMYREYCGGPLSELCAHQIDAVNFFLDSHPLKVTAMGGINYWKDGRDTYDNIRSIFEYKDGIKASFTSILSNAYNGYSVKILGDRATLEIQRDKAFIYPETFENAVGTVDGVTGATIATLTQGKGIELKFKTTELDEKEPTIICLMDFFDCIREKRKPASNAVTAKDASIAICLGNESADTSTFKSWKDEYSS